MTMKTTKTMIALAAFALATGTAQAQQVVIAKVVTSKSSDVQAAIRLGHKLHRQGLSPGQAEAEFWPAAWQRFPSDRFFARCFVATAEEAYEGLQ